MDLTSTKYLETSTLFSSQADATLESNNGLSKTRSMKNPFLDSFSDPFCKLNLKETSDFVKSFPVPNNGTETRGFSEISAQNGVPKRNLLLEAPPTPGRPIFSFSNTKNYSRKCFPSKWDDAEKWLVSGSSCNDSPSNYTNSNNSVALFKSLESSKMYTKQCSGHKPHMGEIFAEKSRITEEKVSKVISNFHGPLVMDHLHTSARAINGVALSASADVLLKGSSTTSRCPTPFKSTSPARHNTPASRSGPLGLTGPDDDITQLQDCHLAKLHSGTQFDSVTTNWSSREEEEEDVSKSLRHFEMSGEFRKSVSESRNNNNINNCVWEEEEKTKSCHRYQREEAKIQAWVNLQSAKAEAESRKFEVKIQKMRANLEEKLMKRMADVHRKAEEWRATAQFQHSEQIRKAGQLAREAMNNRRNNKNSHFSSGHKSCGCFPCNK
ncbi:remorin [Phtheirospermum japonicum]|uniref:Remorin n=1 Tax=Phtheirospermum japonicum TaxID=374723 RepID=A0A830C811_9LAMI|nr:remorin [Phtheirospermum japonicum]